MSNVRYSWTKVPNDWLVEVVRSTPQWREDWKQKDERRWEPAGEKGGPGQKENPFAFFMTFSHLFRNLLDLLSLQKGKKELWILKECKGTTHSDLWHTCGLHRCSGERNWNPQQPHPTNKGGWVVISGSHLHLSCFIDGCKDLEINTPSCPWLPQGNVEMNWI